MKRRALVISRADAGRPITAVLRTRFAVSSAAARRLIVERRVRLAGAPCPDPTRRVRAGQRLEILPPLHGRPTVRERPAARRPAAIRPPVVRFADEHVVVVDKPAGLTTMRHPEEAAEFGPRGRRFLPATLADLLPALLPDPQRGRVRPVHRIDRDTSGLVVFARTREAEADLGRQFRAHTVERRYLALVRGRARDARIESWLVRDRGDGRRGSSATRGAGQHAVTHVRVVEQLGDYSLVECRLETGRTHQVRIHLGEAGTPLCGERVYDRPLHGRPVRPDGSGMARPALHAATLGFDHPATGRRVSWTAPLPTDMAAALKRLRRDRGPAVDGGRG